MSCESDSTSHQSGRRPTSVFSKKVKNITFRPLTPKCVAQFPGNFANDRGGPCHHFRFKTFLARIHSFAARGRWKFGWKRSHRSKLLIVLSLFGIKQPNLAELCRLRTRIKLVNFVKIVQGTRPLGAIILVKFHFFQSWGRKPPPLDRSRWNLAWGSYSLPNFTLIGATCRHCRAKTQ